MGTATHVSYTKFIITSLLFVQIHSETVREMKLILHHICSLM